jgi:GNAT superfamily N-acetyltransferase
MLLVEPEAHGRGQRLVDECIVFARSEGYRKIERWTNSILAEARRIYCKAGFVMVTSQPHHEFGHGLIAETRELKV